MLSFELIFFLQICFLNIIKRRMVFIICNSLSCVPQQNSDLEKFSVFIKTKLKLFIILINELHLGLCYLSKDAKIVIFGLKLTEKLHAFAY